MYISRKEQQFRMDKRHSQGTLPKPVITPVTKTFLRKAQSCSLLETEIISEDMSWGYEISNKTSLWWLHFLSTDIRKEQYLPCRAKKDALLPFLKPYTVSSTFGFELQKIVIFLSLSQEDCMPCIFHMVAIFHKSSVFTRFFPVAFKSPAVDFAIPKVLLWVGRKKNINFI